MVIKQQFNNMAVEEELIKALIIQYDESIRLQKKLLDCGFAEALLSVIPINMKNQEALEALLNKRTNECEKLRKILETVRHKVCKLFAKHEENTHLKEFLDFAIVLSTFRDSNEDIDVESNSEPNLLLCYGISLKDNNKSTINEHESERVGVQLYEMTVNLMSKLSIGNERNPDVSDEISSKCIQNPTSTPAELFNSTITSTKSHFECDTCGRNFLKKRSIILHVHEHMKKNQFFRCTKCGRSFPVQNNEEKMMKCSICDMNDNENGGEEKNKFPIVVLERISSLCCNICGRKSSNKYNLESHIRLVHRGEKPYECTECGKRFGQKSALKTHTAVHNGKSQKTDNISKRKRSEIEMTSVCCDICGKKSSNKYSLKAHIRQVHSGEKPHECTECGKRFAQNYALKIHTSMHTRKSQKIEDFSKWSQSEISSLCCGTCGRKFTTRSSFRAHVRHVHRGEKPHKCTECGKCFARKSTMKMHTLVHGSQRPFKCSVCNVGFKDSSLKNRHERILHQVDTHLQCAHCDKRCGRKDQLISHIYTKHFPEFQKPFVCTICNKSFLLKKQLRDHKLSHKSRTPIKCSVCDSYFKYRANKIQHEMKVHRKGVRFSCEHCDKGYQHKSFLIRHLRNHVE